MESPIVIAIDGPAAAGKSTLARMVADALGFVHVETGRYYRAIGYAIIAEGSDPSDPVSLANIALLLDPASLEKVPVGALQSEHVARTASRAASYPVVRERVTAHVRATVAALGAWSRGAVVEGRDIGTVVFPDADLKVYVTASPEVRLARRAAQGGVAEDSPAYGALAADLLSRDWRDSTRPAGALTRSTDSIEIDTGSHTIGDGVRLVLEHLRVPPNCGR